MSENLARILTETAERDGDRTAVKLDDFEANYELLDQGTSRVAGMLREKGLEPGDRVGIMLPNVPHFALAYYGVLRAGGVVVPMNVLLKGREVKFYLEDPEAKFLFAWEGFADAAKEGAEEAGTECLVVETEGFLEQVMEADPEPELAERSGEDTAVILYTSGTTGKPKGAELTHDNLYKNCTVASKILGDITKDDVILGALPLFHSFGQTCSMNATTYVGAELTMLPRFDPDKAFEIIERDSVSIFMGVPTMYNALLHSDAADGADTSSLRVCVSGGSAMPEELM